MAEPIRIRGVAVLRDFPVRLWARQQEHYESLLREFQLLLLGGAGDGPHSPPRQLVDLAEMFTRRFGPLLETIAAEREDALAAGRDRVDSHVPLVEGAPELLAEVERVMDAVDEYCRSGELLVLPRSPEVLALGRWTASEIVKQYEGGEPAPWPGPF